ncbi:CCN family member 1-like [Lepisosteus oculatus]|uniref:Cellular communication network factor 1, like 2 n=1 Tax=Lepisosteus oculatus TaxID=7918 RepID=W5M3I3_LEPOC|nr:PREDICTED: protein CYR61-like [Lepisosteus oculatus]
MEWARLCALVFLSCCVLVEGSCPLQCSCPPAPPACAPGVSWVLDACGCCKVCARQYNQDCGPSQPCDHIKGLRCHLGAGGRPDRGLCRAEAQGRPCEFSGRLYQHGEDFRPSCQHQCSCMDGVVGCMPLCPHEVPLPAPPCPNPRLVRAPGRCCEEWACDGGNHISEDPPGEPQRTPVPDPFPGLASNELLAPTLQHPDVLPAYPEWRSLPRSSIPAPSPCLLQVTDWSECSATCGIGVSSRVTNANPECRLVRETRLCQVRACDLDVTSSLRRGKQCQRTVRPREPVRITFAGCTTARRYRPRSCGACADARCCAPSLTRTVRLRFRCPDGESFARAVMWVQRCRCRDACQQGAAPAAGSLPSVRLHNDIHTFAR